jgi:hypothetical protein
MLWFGPSAMRFVAWEDGTPKSQSGGRVCAGGNDTIAPESTEKLKKWAKKMILDAD